MEKQITAALCGHILTNINVWSPDSQWIVYDVRSDAGGVIFDGSRIERVNVLTGEVQLLFQSARGAHCGVATYSPVDEKIAFILGPEDPTPEWSYAAYHRRGVIVDTRQPGLVVPLDACNYTSPYTPGALRGGSHVHVFDGDGQRVSFTYEDAVLSNGNRIISQKHINLRGIGVSVPGLAVQVPTHSARNISSDYFSVLVTKLIADPVAGSDQINRAVEEGWVGRTGYLRTDQNWQKHAIAFQGQVISPTGKPITEIYSRFTGRYDATW